MAKLVDVYKDMQPLGRRQLPLVVDETLTMVMDFKSLGLITDLQPVKGKEVEELNRKLSLLSAAERSEALAVTHAEILHVLNQSVPCVGCRRSVERLYYLLLTHGYPTLDPILVQSDGIITIREDKQSSAQFLCTLFTGHSTRLSHLVDNQPRRNKKSHRCLLHSLDTQRASGIASGGVTNNGTAAAALGVCANHLAAATGASSAIQHHHHHNHQQQASSSASTSASSSSSSSPNGSTATSPSASPSASVSALTTVVNGNCHAGAGGGAGGVQQHDEHQQHVEQRSGAGTAWREVWDCMRPACRRDVCVIEATHLSITLDLYLRKHRFCSECRTKVLRAYTLLMEEEKPEKERGYSPALYDGIKRCIGEMHIHLPAGKTEFIAKLINRAEPELLVGGRRERHAKTMEIAQEEVLTCIGICMYERLHRIYMRLREEECTCRVLAAVAVDALWRRFETVIENKQGISQLDLLCAELTREELQKQLRRAQKKLRRKRKQHERHLQNGGGVAGDELADPEPNDASNETKHSTNSLNGDCDEEEEEEEEADEDEFYAEGEENLASDCECKKNKTAAEKVTGSGATSHGHLVNRDNTLRAGSEHSTDCGYASGTNNNCCGESPPSSPDCSEVICTADNCLCHQHRDFTENGNRQCLTLLQMLQDPFYSNADCCYITQEEMNEFKTNSRQVFEKRKELRETLQSRFAQLCVNGPLKIPRLLAHNFN